MALIMKSSSSSSSVMFLLSFSILLGHLLMLVVAVKSGHSRRTSASALYVFGDSLVDSGNNNYLQTEAKVNYEPYGIDFFEGSTGRFTNGKTIVDFIAERLGLPYAPPYLGLSDDEKSIITTGVNYASGAGGILPESGTATGEILSLEKQIDYFKKTVKNDLPKTLKTQKKLSKYLAKSIFVFSIGSNDFINNYLQPANYNSSKTYTPLQFGSLLLTTLKQHLTTSYNLGARKFVVFALGPIGCLPAIVNGVTPKPTTPCLEDVNSLIKIYNGGLPNIIKQLESTLQDTSFVLGDIYQHSYILNQNPFKYGYTGGQTPCCVVASTTGLCLPNKTICKHRNKHLNFDAFHPTHRLNHKYAKDCFSGSSPCVPINIEQLASIKKTNIEQLASIEKENTEQLAEM